MIFKWILPFIFIQNISSQFSFFYQETIPKHLYQNDQQTLIRVNFPFTDQMKISNKNFSAVLIDIAKPFKITDENYKNRDNPVYIQIDDYDFWLGKFHTLHDNYNNVSKNYAKFTPSIYDTEINLAVDSNYAIQKMENINIFKDIIVITMKKYKNVTQLQSHTADALRVIMTLELLVTDFKHFYGTFADLYTTLSLAKKGQVSEILFDRIANQSIIPDWSNTEILQGGTTDNTVTFIIKLAQKRAPLLYYDLKPISYYGYALENDYYVEKSNSQIKKFYLDDKLTPQDMFHLTKCLDGLNKNDCPKVYEHCLFVKTDKTYEIINRGILFHNGTPNVISQINKLFNNQIKQTDFPIVIHFNGSINLIDEAHKTITITKKYSNLFQKSSLTKQNLENLKHKLFLSKENEIVSLLQEEMIGVLLSFATVVILLLTIYLTRCIFRKISSKKHSQKPQEKLILKKLRANRRY